MKPTLLSLPGLVLQLLATLFVDQHGAHGQQLIDCTAEAKICPNGESVGQNGPNCSFSPCPFTSSSSGSGDQAYVCPKDARVCPNGEYVSREGPNCTFAACKTSSAPSPSKLATVSVLAMAILATIALVVTVAAPTLL